jgi:hypothetical protein
MACFSLVAKAQDDKGVCHIVALPFTLKSSLRQKKNYGNSKYFTMQKHNLKKNSLKENQNPSRCYNNNSITNLKFQHKPKSHLSKILI